MRELLMQATGADDASSLETSIRNDRSREMKLRRGIVVASLIGIGAMGVVSLLQTGIVRHLPDPQTRRPHFDTDKVNTSEEAYSWGMPDAPLTVAMHAASLALAAAGPSDRWQKRPLLPIAAAAFAAPQAAVAAQYLFYQMPKVDKAWCPWCVADALVHFAIFGMTLPEAAKAAGVLRDSRAL